MCPELATGFADQFATAALRYRQLEATVTELLSGRAACPNRLALLAEILADEAASMDDLAAIARSYAGGAV